ncbi:uncharacterized protein LY89DRAFT_281464 [Mollisia scopiformis]|uniref:Uncharacterized protein n=1 Tax=Mollisia scopiformis TaxID=149040 RepID=A0A132BA15_MOLSC|nr:uncharacterized protein LY89DRAFT_281464 [Mollisia scopiformis]KUJ09245.1 hypothetical protein LY89DRAFT_281464 [Mollisia scopiformis]
MGYMSKYHGTYPSQWSEWEWNLQHSCYVRYRLVNKNDYEWDSYNPAPEAETTEEYDQEQYSERYPENNSGYTCESTSDFHHDASSQQSDRDSGYHSGSQSSSGGFEDLLDHPDSWTVNPFLAFGFPPAKDHSKKHQQRKQHSKSQTGLDISRTSLHSDEGFSEPSESWITLFGKHSKEVNLVPSVDHQSQVCYVSHSVLKDLGIWESRRMGKAREAWIPGAEEGNEERIKVVGSWTVSWLSTFKGNGHGSGSKMQRTTFRVFKDRKRRVVLGMSPREARKFGISG